MTLYESIFIVRPTLSDEEVAKIGEKIREMIEKRGGSVLKMENWGKKKLAYEVKKEKKGTYLLFYFKGDGKLVAELEHHWLVEDALIKFLTVKAPPPSSASDRADRPPPSGGPTSAASPKTAESAMGGSAPGGAGKRED
jgi:small subunit ribosomal protein S6